MKPIFAVLDKNYPRSSRIGRAALFAQIGWSDVVNNVSFENTCAIRVSVALVKSGVRIPGRMPINAGDFKGKLIEPGQARLSHLLARLWGAPQKYKDSGAAERGIGQRKGVVSFFRIHPAIGDNMGHIDIVSPGMGGAAACGGACYWRSGEVWFWPLK